MSSRSLLASSSRLLSTTHCSCLSLSTLSLRPTTPERRLFSTTLRPQSFHFSAPPPGTPLPPAAEEVGKVPSSLSPPLPLHVHANSLDKVPLPESTNALTLLKSQPSHYVSALLLGRRYLLTPNDILTIPKLKSVPVGATISLTRILEVGSRDYTLRASPSSSSSTGAESSEKILPLAARTTFQPSSAIPRDWQKHPNALPWLEEGLVSVELTVLEHTKGRMFTVEKFKRRKGYRRTLRSKLEFTKLRVGEIKFGGGSESA